tara:strand:- start:685 stop:1089 length:405 start_codon:yes stop_codon:yes gene_type:complete
MSNLVQKDENGGSNLESCMHDHEGRFVSKKQAECHNGWHAYRFVIAHVGLTSDLGWYSNKDAQIGGNMQNRMEKITALIKNNYGIQLNAEDKHKIEFIQTPKQLCETVLPNIFKPSKYPDLICDYPITKFPSSS